MVLSFVALEGNSGNYVNAVLWNDPLRSDSVQSRHCSSAAKLPVTYEILTTVQLRIIPNIGYNAVSVVLFAPRITVTLQSDSDTGCVVVTAQLKKEFLSMIKRRARTILTRGVSTEQDVLTWNHG